MTLPQTITSTSEADTKAFAIQAAAQAQKGDIFALQGPLGAGKSVFARAFIQSLTNEETEVPSPTFTLVQNYDAAKAPIWHFDLYRTENPDEIYEIGWEEALSDGIVLVEWPERLGNLIPMRRKEIIFEVVSDESRKITITDNKEAD